MSHPPKLSPQKARQILWEQHDLQYKLEPTQREIYNFIKTNKNQIIVIAASRRLGKSHSLCAIAVEECLKKPKSTVKYLAGQQRMVRDIVAEIMPSILEDCPPDMRPVYKTNMSCWLFPNGSKIQMAGVDNKRHDKLRGGSSVLCIVDEAAFVDELKYTVRSVLLPTTTTTGGKIVLISTPPESPDHDFVGYMEDAQYRGAFMKKTIWDYFKDFDKVNKKPTRITEEGLANIIEELGGEQSTDFLREYCCEVITEETSALIPEFTDELMEQITVDFYPRPAFYNTYTSMDIGFKDLTVVLFAFYDFKAGKVVIEDELSMSGYQMTTDLLAQKIKEKEESLWQDPITKQPMPVYKRVSDNNLIVLNDLVRLHGLSFIPTAKDDALAALNNLRMHIAQGNIIINKRCETLIRHLKNGKWNKNRTSFARSPDNGHYDAVDSAKYLLRNIDFSKNPFPRGYEFGDSSDLFFSPHYKPKEAFSDWLTAAFIGNKKKK